MFCPSLDQTTKAVLALLPRGRAWQTHENGPRKGSEPAFNLGAYNNDAFATQSEHQSIIWQYWRSFAATAQYAVDRLCALRLEFWCSTMSETLPEWMEEYGLPDACDPFPDICTKVAAIGGTRCEYYAEIAARSGWSISCLETAVSCGSRAGCSKAGKARAGSTAGLATLRIMVYLDESPAYQPTGRFISTKAGRMKAGRRLNCGPNLLPLQCILSRVIHAEIKTLYEVSNGA